MMLTYLIDHQKLFILIEKRVRLVFLYFHGKKKHQSQTLPLATIKVFVGYI